MSLRSEIIRVLNEILGNSKKISELDAAITPLTGTELVEIVQSGENKRVAVSDVGGGGSGTVTSVSVVTANGVSGSVATATTTPAITLTVQATSEIQSGIVELATAAETLTGTDNTRATHPAGVRATYQNGLAAVDVSGTAIAFAVPQFYGTPGAPESGNITLDTTGLVKGMVQVLYHDNGTEPTYPASFVKLSGTYSTTVLNIIYMQAISTTRIEYTISQEA